MCRLDSRSSGCPQQADFSFKRGAGLKITGMSFNGKLGIGILSCLDLVADMQPLADEFPVALGELLTVGTNPQRVSLGHTPIFRPAPPSMNSCCPVT